MECQHEERHIETVQIDFWPTNDIDQSYDKDILICDECGYVFEDEDAEIRQS